MASIEQLRKKLEALKTKKSGNSSNKINYWMPEPGDYNVRIMVPLDDFNEIPVVEQAVHYGVGNKQFTCNRLTPSIETDCPICDQARKFWDLYNESVKEGVPKEALEEVRKAASAHTANKRAYMPIYVKETQEVCLWSLSEKTYEKLLGIIATDEVDDFTSPYNGHDIKVTYSQEKPGVRRTAKWDMTPSFKKTAVVGGKTLDEEKYQELLDAVPVLEITASVVLDMEKALEEESNELAAEASEERLEDTGTTVSAPAPQKEKKSRLNSTLNELREQEDDDDDF